MPFSQQAVSEIASELLRDPGNEETLEQAILVMGEQPDDLLRRLAALTPADAQSTATAREITDVSAEELAKPEGERRHTWKDSVDRRRCEPLLYVKPRSVAELSDHVRRAEAAGLRVKAVGSGHSFSNATDAPDVMINMHALNRRLDIDRDSLRDPAAAARMFRVQGGMLIRDLNSALDRAGLAMHNLGGYTGQTIAGAITTGTHGSGITFGPLADLVLSLQLVTSGGKVYQIEPANGITDPAKFKKEQDGVTVELKQDDDWFYATVVSAGCVGIIASLVLDVRPAYWLEETRTLMSWEGVKEELEDFTVLNQWRHYDVILNPHREKGRHLCLVTKRREVAPPGNNVPHAGRKRNPITELVAAIQGDGRALLFIMNKFPKLIPGLLDRSVGALADKQYIARSFKVFDLGAINEVRAYGIEVAVPLDLTIPATERVFEIAERARALGSRYTTAPFALRFTSPSKALIAPQFGRATCMIEMISLYGAVGCDELLYRYERELFAFSGRPHWGLSLDSIRSRDRFRALYHDSFDRWFAVYRQLNAQGTFNNAFTDRVGISM
jgi:FAD/FMN-containing dehydrogenase